MSDTRFKTHPLIIAAATAVILTCLVAIGIMTGIVPSPITRDRGADERGLTAQDRSASLEARIAPNDTAPRTKLARPGYGEGSGSTASSGPSRSVSGRQPPQPTVPPTSQAPAPAPKVAAICSNCGTVTSVRAVKQQGEAGLVGPAAGTAVGGLIGNQIGSGSGNTIATIAGAAIGAGVGTEVERRVKSTTHYVVGVRLQDGTSRSFTYRSAPGVQQGDRVRVVDGQLVRDS